MDGRLARLKGWAREASLSLSATVAGYQVEASLVPLRWARPAFRSGDEVPSLMRMDRRWHFHLFVGPLHVWSMTTDDLLAASVRVDRNPFHGSPLVPRRGTVRG